MGCRVEAHPPHRACRDRPRAGDPPETPRREEAPELTAVEAEETDDTEILLQRLIDAASPAERARLHAMSEEQRMSILRLMRDQNEDRDARRLRKRA